MHPLLDVRPWPRILLQYPLLVLTAALLGAVGAFGYSYAPLHRAKNWQIEYLQSRLESRNEQVASLEEKLLEARSSLDGQPSGEDLGALRAQLEEANDLSGSLRKQLRDLERQLEQATQSRDDWKKKHAAALREIESAKAAAAAPSRTQPLARAETSPEAAPEPDRETGAPAAPAPVVSPLPQQE